MIKEILAGLVVLASSIGTAAAQNCGTYPNTLTNGQPADANQVMANFNFVLNCVNGVVAPRGYLSGLTLSTAGGSAAYGIAVGVATSSDAAVSMNLATAYTKTTGAWAVGSGNGSLDTGSIANNTWYHVFLIERVDTSVVDVLISTSATSPTLPTNYTKQRRIGSLKTDGSALIIAFSQLGDEFLWSAPILDVSAFNLTTTSVLKALSVPTGVQTMAKIHASFQNSANAIGLALVSAPDAGIQVVNTPSANLNLFQQITSFGSSQDLIIRTDTSGQIRAVSNQSASSVFTVVTYGWIDTRGR